MRMSGSLAMVMVLLTCVTAWAAGPVDIAKEKAFVVDKVEAAAKLVKTQGVDAAIKAVNDPASEFMWGSDYVYLMDLEVNILAHPTQPGLIGRNLVGLRCPVGDTPFFAEMFENVNAWVLHFVHSKQRMHCELSWFICGFTPYPHNFWQS